MGSSNTWNCCALCLHPAVYQSQSKDMYLPRTAHVMCLVYAACHSTKLGYDRFHVNITIYVSHKSLIYILLVLKLANVDVCLTLNP